MAPATKTGKRKTKAKNSLSDTQRWVYGIILFIFAIFLLVAVVSYYFYWADDQSIVRWGDMWDSTGVVMNPAGRFGSVAASYIVGEWFGVFGVIIPIVFIILSLRIINYKPLVLRRSVRVSLTVMILGSLTLGFIFGTSWGIFGTGLGGAQGIFVSRWIRSYLGIAGTSLLLLLGWILLAVYLNRRTIGVVNKVGQGIFDSGKKVGETVINQATELVTHRHAHAEDEITQEYTEGEVYENHNIVPDSGDSSDYEPEEQFISDGVAEPDDSFEITDSRTVNITDGDFGIVVPREEYEAETASNKTVNLDDGPFEVGYAGGDAEIIGQIHQVQNPGEYTVGDGTWIQTPVIIPGSSPGNVPGGLEVVDHSGNSLSIGGVIETTGNNAVDTDTGLQVVVAGRRDAELEEDDIDDSIYDPTRELSRYQKPPVELLEDHSIDVQVTEEEIIENKNQIVRTLKNFGINIDKIKATIGPTVTLYEIIPSAGVKISKIKNLEDDIALSLKALGIRIIAPMPGKGTVGIEVPNKDKEIVSMYSVVKTVKFQESNYELPIVLGKTISNETYMIDLAKMPHLLVAGATGQGKSVGLNAIITSLLYRKHPAELKFVLVDPKRVELSLYSKLERHFLARMSSEEESILTDTQKVVYTLNALCQEMSDRYDLLRLAEVKKLSEYNDKFTSRRLNPKKGHRFLPYIVVVIDEFADMIMTAGREVEAPITRLAQLARAVGIHLVIATQRPDVKVITGLIKANFPARIAFRVMSMVDSRTIIDQPGANQLIGRGDMLMSLNGEMTRVQCAFIDTPEIERITEFISNQRGYSGPYELPDYAPDTEQTSKNVDMDKIDPMFEEVARFVVQNQQGSTSSVQRRFSIGYNRAGRIMDQLEAAGVVGRGEGSKPREVLIMDIQSLEYIMDRLD